MKKVEEKLIRGDLWFLNFNISGISSKHIK